MAIPDDRDTFMKAMDVQQPDWWIRFATQEDLVQFVYKTRTWRGETADSDTITFARESLRRSVASQLEMPVRAYVQGCG